MNPAISPDPAAATDALSDAYRQGMRLLAAGVCLITASRDGERGGMVATAVTSVSAEPPTLLVCINRSASIFELIQSAGRFCVNVLGKDCVPLVEVFSNSARRAERFETGDWTMAASGSPLAAEAIVSFDCRVAQIVDWHSHAIFIGEVECVYRSGSPLEASAAPAALPRPAVPSLERVDRRRLNEPLPMTETMLSPAALDALFLTGRSHNGWRDEPVPDERLQTLYELVKMGPTSANCSPARFVFVRTAEGKERLRPALSSGNLHKTMTAPVTVIVASDRLFYDKLPQLFPHGDARSWFTSSPAFAAETALRNGSMQAAYLMLAARSLGLDAGPLSGFDRERLDAAFFEGTTWTANLLVNLGQGDPAKLFGRLPRLGWDDACVLA